MFDKCYKYTHIYNLVSPYTRIYNIIYTVTNLLEYFISRNLVYSCCARRTPRFTVIITMIYIILFISFCAARIPKTFCSVYLSLHVRRNCRRLKGKLLTHPSADCVPTYYLKPFTAPEFNEDRTRLSALLPCLLSPTPTPPEKKKERHPPPRQGVWESNGAIYHVLGYYHRDARSPTDQPFDLLRKIIISLLCLTASIRKRYENT